MYQSLAQYAAEDESKPIGIIGEPVKDRAPPY
jgi:hypothetical protein